MIGKRGARAVAPAKADDEQAVQQAGKPAAREKSWEMHSRHELF